VTAAAIIPLRTLRATNELSSWFAEDDPALVDYQAYRHSFGNDELIIAVFDLQKVTLQDIDQATEALTALAMVTSAWSPTSLPRLGSDGVELWDADTTSATLAADPLLGGRVISRDGRFAGIVLRTQPGVPRPQVLAEVRATLGDLPHDLGGVAVVNEALNRISKRDAGRFLGLGVLVSAILLFIAFGRVRPVLASLLAIVMAAIWTLGALAASGRSINLVTLVLPLLVAVIGLSDAVHILLRAADQREKDVAMAIADVLRPCAASTLTTVAAFLSLTLSPMPALVDLGLFGALGLMCTFVTTLVTSAWVLGFRGGCPRPGRGRLASASVRLALLGARRPKQVVFVACLLTAGAVVAATWIEVDTRSLGLLPPDNPTRQAAERISTRFAKPVGFELLVEAEDALDPALLGAVWRWQRQVVADGVAGWSTSVVDLLARATGAYLGTDEVPSSPDAVEQALMVADALTPTDRFVRRPGTLRVVFGIPMRSARGLEAIQEEVMSRAALPDATVRAVGYVPLFVAKMDRIVWSQVRSVAWSFLLVFTLVGLALGSARAALLSVPANLVPIALLLGAMGVFGVPLASTTATLAAVVLGLVVDDSVHFLHRLRREQAAGGELSERVRRAAHGTGRAMVMTTFVLVGGLSVLGFATITTLVWFGWLMAIALVLALLSDLVLLPAVLGLRR